MNPFLSLLELVLAVLATWFTVVGIGCLIEWLTSDE